MRQQNLHCAFYQSKQRLTHHLVIVVITISKKFFDGVWADLWQDVS